MRLAKTLLASTFGLGLVVSCSDRAPTAPPSPGDAARLSQAHNALETQRAGTHGATRVVAPRVGSAPVLQGLWGGDHIGLMITASGASVEFDCAGGSIDEPFVTDSAGHFDLAGTTWFTPPVIYLGWQPDKRPAHYSGTVTGNIMTLTVTSGDPTGEFRLAHGAVPRLLRCV